MSRPVPNLGNPQSTIAVLKKYQFVLNMAQFVFHIPL